MAESANLQLPYIEAGQAQKHVTYNEGLRVLDALVQARVVDRDLTTPPGSPADGAVYIPASGATGAWSTWDLNLAYWADGAWTKIVPQAGWMVWLIDEEKFVRWSGSAWLDAMVSPTASNVFTAGQIFAGGSGAIDIESTNPWLRFNETDAPTDKKRWGFIASGGSFFFQLRTDDDVSAGNRLVIARTGVTIDSFTLTATLLSLMGGMTIGSPTGGNKGAGTLNATAVYDDNSLLSCYPFTAALRRLAGEADPAKLVTIADWDEKVADRVIPGEPARVERVQVTETVTVEEVAIEVRDGRAIKVSRTVTRNQPVFDELPLYDEAGAPVMVQVADPADPTRLRTRQATHRVPRMVEVEVPAAPERRERRVHDGARKFAARLGTEHDPLTLDGYARHWMEKLHLTSLPNEARFDPERGLSTGEWVQRLVETVEIQAVLIEQLNVRLKAMEARR